MVFRYRVCNDVIEPMLLGIVPDILLLPSSMYCNDVNDPILLGVVPYRLLAPRFNTVNDVNDPILLGIVPINDRPTTDIDVTLAYVADVLFESQYTP